MKMLVVGINGMLGHKFAEIARNDFQIVGTYRRFLSERAYPIRELDIVDRAAVTRLVREEGPEIVVNCAAVTDLDFCEEHPDIAEAVNVGGTRNLAEAARANGARFIYFSTDSVGDGRRGNYTEEKILNPINVYSRTKLDGEKFVTGNGLAVRTTMYGWSIGEKKSLAEWIIEELSTGRQINMYSDTYFTPAYTGTLSRVVLEMVRRKLSGIYNVPGNEKISKYEFSLKVASVFRLDTTPIRRVSIDSAVKRAPRPKDLSLDSGKIKREGFKLNNVEEDLRIMKKEKAD